VFGADLDRSAPLYLRSSSLDRYFRRNEKPLSEDQQNKNEDVHR